MSDTEQRAAEDLGYILKYLELNNEMERFLSLYELLLEENLDGMHIIKYLKDYCEAKNVSFLPERAQMLESYVNYTYMKRKWKKEMRRHKDLNYAWEDVAVRVCAFGKPMWLAICDGRPFVGDWMPKLGRFLE